MESVEFEALLSDVETRLDRLKALYEQWFQGIERLEPAIARKEVDRRMVLLRKEQPRNTALRFRFQTLVQRYTTLQTYWGRIARQIEEGTYRRDLLKARTALLASKAGRRRALEDGIDIEVDVDASEQSSDGSLPPGTPAGSRAPEPAGKPAGPALAAATRPALSPIAPAPSVIPGAATPRVVSPFARAAPRPASAPASPAPLAAPTSPAPLAAPTSPAPLAAATSPAPDAAATSPAPGAAPSAVTPPTMAFARPDGSPRPGCAPTQAAAATPAPARATAATQGPTRIAATFARPSADPPTPGSLSEQELRRVYERYAAARRKNHEPDVSYESLAKNLREVAPKMREKYGKPIDFEVVLKDGKVGLKPVPRG